MDVYIVTMLVFVLVFSFLTLILNVAIASFLVNGVKSFNERLNEIAQEPLLDVSKSSRVIPNEGGLMDIEGAQTYDPKFIDSKYVEN